MAELEYFEKSKEDIKDSLLSMGFSELLKT